jgi:hypothetical protein
MRLLIAVIFLAAVAGCGSRPGHERAVRRSFYYWRGTFRLTTGEIDSLRKLDIRRLYVRLFDVAIDRGSRQPHPVGPLAIAMPAPPGIDIVPTVFITNEVMRTIDSAGRGLLAHNVVEKIVAMAPGLGRDSIGEIQIDCDWTTTTRGAYFAFLRDVATLAAGHGWKLSATVRLHQLRDRLMTGIPPVDRGMLMVYNTGNPTDPTETNAIFDPGEIRGYLRGLADYPLPLDVALPLFSWGVVFHEGAFLVLLNNLRPEDLDRPEVQPLGDSWYRLSSDIYINGVHLFSGDRIRIEEVDRGQCAAVASLISSQLPGDSLSVSLFHLDPSILKNHACSDLSALYSALR